MGPGAHPYEPPADLPDYAPLQLTATDPAALRQTQLLWLLRNTDHLLLTRRATIGTLARLMHEIRGIGAEPRARSITPAEAAATRTSIVSGTGKRAVRTVYYTPVRENHFGARASCPPTETRHAEAFEQDGPGVRAELASARNSEQRYESDNRHDATTPRFSDDLRTGDFLDVIQQRAGCPRSVAYENCELEVIPGGKLPQQLENASPGLVSNGPAAGSRLHSDEYPSAQAHKGCPPSVESGETPVAITIPLYDPSLDVVKGLPKSLKDKPGDGGYLCGFGNKYLEAVRSYYARNIADYRETGRDWQEFGMGCTVVEMEDDYGRSYFMAFAVGSPWSERLLSYEAWLAANEADDFVQDQEPVHRHDATPPRLQSTVDLGPRSEPFQGLADFNRDVAFDHGARASCSPVEAQGNAACEQPAADQALRRRAAAVQNELPSGESVLEFDKRAECPRSVDTSPSLVVPGTVTPLETDPRNLEPARPPPIHYTSVSRSSQRG